MALAYFGNTWRRAQQQRAIVKQIKAAGGEVRYSYQFASATDAELMTDINVLSGSYTFEETPDGRRKRTLVTPTGTFQDIGTPPGPWVIRWFMGDDVFAQVDTVDFFSFRRASPGEFPPKVLLGLPELKSVVLVGPQVSDKWLERIADVPMLQDLALYGDEGTATSAGLEKLKKAEHLKGMAFSGQWVQDEAVDRIADLRKLESLTFNRTPNITSAVFSDLADLTQLRELRFTRVNGINDQGTECLGRFTKLEVLFLPGTAITNATFAHLAGLTKLNELVVSETSIGDPALVHLARLTSLRGLDLGGTKVGDKGLAAISHLSRLRHLSLVATRVTDAGMPALSRLTQLEGLTLEAVAVTDKGLPPLRSLTNLKHLSLGPHVTKQGVDALRQALPGCKIYRLDENGESYLDD